MKQLFGWGSHVAALLGFLVCLAAGILGLTNWGSVFGYDIDTVFLVGVAGMVFACLLRLTPITELLTKITGFLPPHWN